MEWWNLFWRKAKEVDIRSLYSILDELPVTFVLDFLPKKGEVDSELLKRLNFQIENHTLNEGMSLEEARTLLQCVVYNTRKNLELDGHPFETDSLIGCCGFCQSSSLFPLEELGFSTTVNNVGNFPNCYCRHAFGTVRLPIKEEEGVYFKSFLIDCSYQQFFLIRNCNEGKYLKDGLHSGSIASPDAGYFMMQDEKCCRFARELLENGFVELTEENAKMYATGFILSSYNLEDFDIGIDTVKNLKGSDVIDVIYHNQVEHDYDREEFVDWGCNVSIKNGIENYSSYHR